ncbi:hypothetical protein Poli38472_003603 [Pythium oligandrum]|uniref:Peptidase A1 domain-containing protein n=1 Tax=Pythium oligandrum TaxID=41045 RepID=A0A8K1CMX2_PYTOL|nr:hypothetical protein Poli38472_003603 [Pythium oligandrum]|eukprot:TMW65838.1 hypothetical protein Poli38472_003603 [Pythium oligandrum]
MRVRRRRRQSHVYNMRAGVFAVVFMALAGPVDAEKAQYSLDLYGISSGAAYTVEVDVGSSGETAPFRLIADTGSSNDAVLGAGCCGSGATVTFDCEASSTCQPESTQNTLEFAGATISGHFVKDKWSSSEIGSITKEFLVIEDQDTFYRTEYDGITGLAYKKLAAPKDSPKDAFYQNMVDAKSTKDAFGLQMCGIMQPMLSSSNFSLHAGQLLVGGDQGLKGEALYVEPMLYTPIIQEAWFVVAVSDVGFDGESLGLPCSSYNDPQAIIDSGTSNIAFPSDVYNALMDRIKTATKKTVPDFDDSYFDYSKSCCGEDYCDPSDAKAALLSLPSIYVTLAMSEDGSSATNLHYTVEIPPEYYFRPEMNGQNTDVPCRAIGIAEGSAIVLGAVLMDGLFSYHDRENARIGLAVAKNCPNGVTSTKKLSIAESKTDDWCKCFSKNLQKRSSIVTYFPWGSGCYYVPWWMYVVIASVVVVVICIGVLGYWYWSGRRDKQKAQAHTNGGSVAAQPVTIAPRNNRSETPQHDKQSHYAAMESPREPLDSGGSSIVMLTTSSREEARKTGKQRRRSSSRTSRASSSSTRAPSHARADNQQPHHRETDGFLL